MVVVDLHVTRPVMQQQANYGVQAKFSVCDHESLTTPPEVYTVTENVHKHTAARIGNGTPSHILYPVQKSVPKYVSPYDTKVMYVKLMLPYTSFFLFLDKHADSRFFIILCCLLTALH